MKWFRVPRLCSRLGVFKPREEPDSWKDPKSRSPNSGLQYSSGVGYITLRWIYLLDPPRGLGRQRLFVLVSASFPLGEAAVVKSCYHGQTD